MSMVKSQSRLNFAAIAAAFLIFSPATQAAPGPGGGNQAGTNPTTPDATTVLADANFTTRHFSGSGVCGDCHNGLTDAEGNDVSIENDWSGSMMAHAFTDPFWQAKVASELLRNPNPAVDDAINETCSRCHAPMANFEAADDGAPISIFADGFTNPDNPYFDAAMDGVSCTLCHQIEDTPELGTVDGFDGNFSIGTYSSPPDRPVFGQYLDPSINPMRRNAQFTPTFSDHVSSSEMCATCHNLSTPTVDSEGNVVSTEPDMHFPEQQIYTEWENSVYGAENQTCQSCHMPAVDGVRLANRPADLAPRDDFARHTLVGANTMMLDILDKNRDALGVPPSTTSDDFAASIANARGLLASAAELEILSASQSNGVLRVDVEVTNRSGHKVPSGYPSRRTYLHFVVRDEAGETVFESGRLNPDGSIVGVAADEGLANYEPHHETITSEDEVQVYESIMADTGGALTYTLLRADDYVKDNRLLPLGFNKDDVPDEVKVAGVATDDGNFTGGSDIVTYELAVDPAANLQVDVELKYQSIAFGYAQDLFLDAEADPVVARFKDLFESATIRAETIATATTIVQ